MNYFDTGFPCRWCKGTVFPMGKIVWPGGEKCVCHTCGTVDTYYPRYEQERENEQRLEIQAKIDALRLRDEVTLAEIELDQKLHVKEAHEKMMLVKRQQQGEPEYTLDDYDKAFQDLQDCNNQNRYLELNFRLCEIREALDTQE